MIHGALQKSSAAGLVDPRALGCLNRTAAQHVHFAAVEGTDMARLKKWRRRMPVLRAALLPVAGPAPAIGCGCGREHPRPEHRSCSRR